MLAPKKIKHRKWHKKAGTTGSSVAVRGTKLSFGQYGLQSAGTCWITSRQIEAARRTITRFIKRGGKVWIRIFPDKPVTAKGGEVPMGKGKGSVDHYVVAVKPGMILFELSGVEPDVAKRAMILAGHKLPIKVRFVNKLAK